MEPLVNHQIVIVPFDDPVLAAKGQQTNMTVAQGRSHLDVSREQLVAEPKCLHCRSPDCLHATKKVVDNHAIVFDLTILALVV